MKLIIKGQNVENFCHSNYNINYAFVENGLYIFDVGPLTRCS